MLLSLRAGVAPRPRLNLRPIPSERNCNGYSGAGARPVKQVISIFDVINVNVVRFVPIGWPRIRPRINERHPIAVIKKSRVPAYEVHREAVYAEKMVMPEIQSEAILGNSVTDVTAPLPPSAVVILP